MCMIEKTKILDMTSILDSAVNGIIEENDYTRFQRGGVLGTNIVSGRRVKLTFLFRRCFARRNKDHCSPIDKPSLLNIYSLHNLMAQGQRIL